MSVNRRYTGERFADLKSIRHPTQVVQGFHDEMIPVRNSYAERDRYLKSYWQTPQPGTFRWVPIRGRVQDLKAHAETLWR